MDNSDWEKIDKIVDYQCSEEHYEEMERRNHPTPEQLAIQEQDKKDRLRLGIERWARKKREEAEKEKRKREEELLRHIRHWRITQGK